MLNLVYDDDKRYDIQSTIKIIFDAKLTKVEIREYRKNKNRDYRYELIINLNDDDNCWFTLVIGDNKDRMIDILFKIPERFNKFKKKHNGTYWISDLRKDLIKEEEE